MGNEASLEGGEGGPVASAPPGSGQLLKPINGAAAGAGKTLEPTAAMNRLAGGGGPPSSPMQGSGNPYPKVVHDGSRHSQTSSLNQSQIQASSGYMAANQSPGQHASRRNLHVDFSSTAGRTGRSPTVSPDRANAPTTPYSVPQIAPMPSSKLCPICNTAELTSVDGSPNFNKCTQCHTTVCNQCGFNPNPHLIGVKEWLCLNCQMQRALGIDMTTPRSKSQQQIHSPSHQSKPDPIPKTQLSAQPTPQLQSQTQTQLKIQPQTQASSGIQRQISPTGPYQTGLNNDPQTTHQGQKEVARAGSHSGPKDPQRLRGDALGSRHPDSGIQMGKLPHPGAVPLPGLVKAQSQSDLGRGSPVRFSGQSERTRSAGSSPARQAPSHETPPQDGLTKLFGFGASLLNQASTLISVDPLSGPSPQPSPVRNQSAQGSRVIFNDANAGSRAGPPGTAKTSPAVVVLSKGPEAALQQQSPAHHQKGQKQQKSPTHHQITASQQQMSSLKQPQPDRQKLDVTCPLCKTAFNIGTTEPPNYRSCTQCHMQVCNLCGFNPTPHLLEKKEWLCLNCQTQRLMSGGLDPLPVPHPSPNRQPVASPKQQQTSSQRQQMSKAMMPQQKPLVSQQSSPSTPMTKTGSDIKTSLPHTVVTATATSITTTYIGEGQRKESAPKMEKESEFISKPTERKKITEPIQTTVKDDKKDIQKSKYYEETSKTNSNNDLSRSPQSLSDTGYSSDGVSSSQSEITGLIQEEELKLNERGVIGHDTPPSPSEFLKLESSMRPLLESKLSSEGEKTKDNKREKDHIRKHRSRSISLSPEEYDSDEDLEGIMEEEEEPSDWETKQELRSALGDNKKKILEAEEMTDEEFMRRQIMEMSADEDNEDEFEEEEDNEDEGYSYEKQKKTQKHISDSGKEKHRLTYQSSSFEEDSKTTSDVYKGSAEEDHMASQGGLRRFKTIELNNSNSYSRDIELNHDNDLSLDREPELEMESLTGSPEERSRGEYSSTLPPTTSSYSSGISPTSISSMEDDSDSSPSRRQRLEEAKQQRKARHRSHGPLLPTIEDSSEEDELREEEELLREQEKMREVEQQRIRSTVRKTKRDKEELRAQRRRERSKTPPSNLSPIEDASPTEELRQAAEMEELHRSSCSEYSPSADSDAEGYEMPTKLYKSGSEYNLPTFMSLYSPTEKPQTTSPSAAITTTSSGRQLKSAEEVYEEMMRKAEMLQKQQKQLQQQSCSGQQYSPSSYQETDIRNRQEYEDEFDYVDQDDMAFENEDAVDIYEEIRQTSQNISKQLDDQMEMDDSFSEKQLLDTGSAFAKLLEQSNALLTPGTSPTQLSAPVSFSETGTGGRIPDVRVTQHFSKDVTKDRLRNQAGKNGITPTVAATTIAAYGVYARDAVTISHTSASQTVSTTQTSLYGRQTGNTTMTTSSATSMSHKIAAITQAYNQNAVRKVSVSKGVQMRDSSSSSESGKSSIRAYMYHERSPPLSPTSSPTHSPSLSPSRRTSEFSTQTVSSSMLASAGNVYHTSSVLTQSTQTSQKIALPCHLQKSPQNRTFVTRTEEFEPTCPQRPGTVNTATSPLSSPTRFSRQSTFDDYSPPDSPPDIAPHQQSPHPSFYRSYKPAKVNAGTSMVTPASMYTHGSLSMDNISLCHISTVPGTSRIEHGQRFHSGSVVDLRTAMKPTPFIMTDQGMDLTSLSPESQRYSGSFEGSTVRQSTTVQPLIMSLNTQEQLHVVSSTATTVSVTVAASMFMSKPNQSVLYCDPLDNRVDLGKGMGPVVCLALNKSSPNDPSIPKIDAKLEELSIQQQQLLKQQQKLQQQQQILEEQLQQHHQLQQQQTEVSFAKVDSSSRVPVLKKETVVTQTSTATEVSALSPAYQQEAGMMTLTNVKPHTMMVQMAGTAQASAVTQLVKTEDNQDVMDLSGQIKSENQVTCCDVVYNLPFGGSCVGVPFSQKTVLDETSKKSSATAFTQPQLYQQADFYQDGQTYQNCAIKSYTLPFPRRLQPSMSETNLADAGLLSYSAKLDPHYQSSGELYTDTGKDIYDGGYSGMGLQYGSYTDLRQGNVAALPIRRYSSLTNISSDSGYFPGEFAESNLAQYSATTAREISRMCAALNSMDRYSSNPDILQLAAGRYSGPPFKVNLQQGPRHSFKYGSDGKPLSHSQTLTDLINARQASLRAMYPSAIRSVDGMIYSTINTPIASTVPITTQPASVLQPLLRGVYRPYAAPNMTPVPLASLTRLPVAPRTGQLPFQYPTPNIVSVTTARVTESLAITEAQDTPLFLGKSPAEMATPTQSSSVPVCSATSAFILTQMVAPVSQPDMPINLSISTKTSAQSRIQHQQPRGTPSGQSCLSVHGQSKTDQPSPSGQRDPSTTALSGSFFPNQERESEEILHQQQEQLLQLERERVEMEKMRQLRLQEELERERVELQRDREKEQILVQREIQDLQTIKQQVLKQQQAERESQLILQKEQLAQQKKQLDQIQSLQQQLQQQLEEQKRQKSVVGNTNSQHISSKAGKTNQPQEFVQDVLYNDQVQVFLRSASEMCLRNSGNQTENRSIRKQRSMPRLQDGNEREVTMFPLPKRLINSSVQTDDEDGEERYLVSRRRRTRRSMDCSVQTDDDEDKAEWEQPVRRRRSRYSRHVNDSGVDHKSEIPPFSSSTATRATSSSIAVQTIRDCSCQTETDQLSRVSPSIHVTVPDPSKVEIVHYISGPERTQKGQSLACQTDPEIQPQSIVAPQISIANTVCPSNVQLVGSADQLSPSHQNVMMLARRRPDPLEFGYQQHLTNESLSSLIRQQPKSPQVLYSPVSPLSSPQHTIETSFSSSERLNKAHVTPQKKSSIGEPLQRHQALPRPMKNIQRSLSDPKPLSPTTDENTKARISFYQQQALQSQLAALQQSSLLRKVKRTLPSPPPEETLTMVAPNLSQMFMPSLSSFKGGSRLAAKTSLLKDLTHELKAVEQESSKLRKQQAELEEEEKEIDAKLRYLELGITQRKETLVKDRERRELAYLRCMGDSRDYMSDSELNNLRHTSAATSFEGNGLMTRPNTAPLSHFTCELNTAAQFPPTSSFMPYQYQQNLITTPTPHASTLQSTGYNQPPYPSVTQAQALPQPTTLQTYPTPSYQVLGTFPSQSFPLSQPPYPTDTSVPPPTQPSHPGFQSSLPPTGATTYSAHSAPYPSQAPPYPVNQTSTYQPQADTLTFQQKPRQTSLADLEQKMATNYEVVSHPTVTVQAHDTTYNQSGLGPSFGQYSAAGTSTYGSYMSSVSNSFGGSITTSASSVYVPYTATSSSSYGQFTTTTANTYGYTVTPASSYGQYNTNVTNTYGQAPLSDHMQSVDSQSMYSSDGLYGSSNLEQNVSRNYVMIEDICELTKEGMGTGQDSQRSESHGRYGTDVLHTRGGSSCGRPEDERDADLYDQHHGRGKSTGSYQAQGTNAHSRVAGSSSMGGGSSFYYDDYKHSAPTRAAAYRQKSLWPPAVISSRKSKHRKQNIEQKISKFSPIEEAHDVEADLASYTMSTSATSGYGSGSQYYKLLDDIYGQQSTYDPQWGNYSDNRLYGCGRSRSAGYGMDKISSCERGYSSRSHEGGSKDRPYHGNYGHSARPSLHSQYSEKEGSHLMMTLMGAGRAFNYPSNSYGSSHSLPDVQDHIRDLPRTYVYARDDMYIIDDMHCAVSDSEAYHLGQEETDWFEKPRDVRGSRQYGSNGHSSRRGHVKHSYHDYDEPPEDLWPQSDYGHSRHISSRDHRHHSSGSSGRHSSRHSDEPRSSRSSRTSKDPSMRHDSRSLSSSGRRGESRSQGYHSSDYSRDPSGQHHSSRSGKQSSHHQGSSSRKQQDHLSSSRQPGSLGPTQKGPGGPSSSSRQQSSSQSAIDGQQGQRSQLPQQAQTSAARPGLQISATGSAQPQLVQAQQLQSKPTQAGPMARQTTSVAQTVPTSMKPEPVSAIGAKAAPMQPAKTNQPPLTGIGSKAAPRPGGIGSAAAGQAGLEGESVLSKILPGGAAEQAGKLGEAISGFGKKFSSLW